VSIVAGRTGERKERELAPATHCNTLVWGGGDTELAPATHSPNTRRGCHVGSGRQQ